MSIAHQTCVPPWFFKFQNIRAGEQATSFLGQCFPGIPEKLYQIHDFLNIFGSGCRRFYMKLVESVVFV